MSRRKFLARAAATGGSSAAVSTPAFAQSTPEVRWRVASTHPKALVSIHGAMEMVTKRVAELTGERFTTSLHAAGELAPGASSRNERLSLKKL